MMDVYVIGTYSTVVQKWPDLSPKDLTREAYLGVMEDAGFSTQDGDQNRIESAWFGNCGMWVDGQGSIRGQVCLTPLVRAGLFPERVSVTNVEGGCATASMALQGACKDVAAGLANVSIAIGVEKTFYPGEPEKTSQLFYGGIDQYDPQEWQQYYAEAGAQAGKEFAPDADRTVFMDTYAMQACYHMKKFGTTQQQIAAGAAKNHCFAVHNPKAQYRFPMTVEEVLADRPVTHPLTRAMCAPIGDGAAAAIVCSGEYLKTLPEAVRTRAVRVAGMALSGGKYRSLDEPGLSHHAALRAYMQAGITPDQVDVAEVHDATSFCELYQVEMLGFCDIGQGGPFVADGQTALGGTVPVNTSGGLVSKGHPVGATGLSMIYELATQLRGEAGKRQVANAQWALAENGGGVVGFDEAACSVIVLHKDA